MDEESNYDNEVNNINLILDKKEIKPIILDKLKIGQHIYITFTPYSLKYVYTLVPKYGKIININLDDKIFPDITILNYKNEVDNLFHSSVSYYGDNLGYDYVISLVE